MVHHWYAPLLLLVCAGVPTVWLALLSHMEQYNLRFTTFKVRAAEPAGRPSGATLEEQDILTGTGKEVLLTCSSTCIPLDPGLVIVDNIAHPDLELGPDCPDLCVYLSLC
jgi:hypothetical protein